MKVCRLLAIEALLQVWLCVSVPMRGNVLQGVDTHVFFLYVYPNEFEPSLRRYSFTL
jgi:hypothetical protein